MSKRNKDEPFDPELTPSDLWEQAQTDYFAATAIDDELDALDRMLMAIHQSQVGLHERMDALDGGPA